MCVVAYLLVALNVAPEQGRRDRLSTKRSSFPSVECFTSVAPLIYRYYTRFDVCVGPYVRRERNSLKRRYLPAKVFVLKAQRSLVH